MIASEFLDLLAYCEPSSPFGSLITVIKKLITVWATEIGAMNVDGKGPLTVGAFDSRTNRFEANQILWLAWGVQKGTESDSLFESIDMMGVTEWEQLVQKRMCMFQ
jgi:hypothetical protein